MPSVERLAAYVKRIGGHRSPRTGSCCPRRKTKFLANSRLHGSYPETFGKLPVESHFRAYVGTCPKTLPPGRPQIADSMAGKICRCGCPQTDVFDEACRV